MSSVPTNASSPAGRRGRAVQNLALPGNGGCPSPPEIGPFSQTGSTLQVKSQARARARARARGYYSKSPPWSPLKVLSDGGIASWIWAPVGFQLGSKAPRNSNLFNLKFGLQDPTLESNRSPIPI